MASENDSTTPLSMSDIIRELQALGAGTEVVNNLVTVVAREKWETAKRAAAQGATDTSFAVELGLALGAMTRRIAGVSLAIGSLHNAFSEELLDGVEQLMLDLQREAERLEKACDDIIERQGAV